eukprot:ANDGO_02971.mRNA.1 hypothetical protein
MPLRMELGSMGLGAKRVEIEGRVVCIGDVHGRVAKVQELFGHLRTKLVDFDDYSVVFMGDYCDRFSGTRETLDWFVALQRDRPKTYFLCGNHDLGMMAFLQVFSVPEEIRVRQERTFPTPDQLYCGPGYETMHLQGRRWGFLPNSIYSASRTLTSYGLSPTDGEAFRAAVPQSHREFLRDLPWIIEHPCFLFIHAGLEELRNVDEQVGELQRRDVHIARVDGLSSRDCDGLPKDGRWVVSGHVQVAKVRAEQGRRRWLVDTAGTTEMEENRFSALVMDPAHLERVRIITMTADYEM